jgi:hypothetical protein
MDKKVLVYFKLKKIAAAVVCVNFRKMISP